MIAMFRALHPPTLKGTRVAQPTLNERASRLADFMANSAASLRIQVTTTPSGAKLLDCGIKAPGGIQAGLALARVCLAGQAEVSIVPGDTLGLPLVVVSSDAPILACMASQYAGWQVAVDKYFAMGSGPFRAAYGQEEIYDKIPGRETSPVAVGCLETRKLPDDAVVAHLAEALKIPPNKITLLAAPAASQAGNVQVVARAVETALHKLHQLDFDLNQVVSAFGSAPLPPVANSELIAIGRTNDAILYGARVQLWVQSQDDLIAEVGPKVPSSGSADFGEPFAEIFKRYNQKFYEIDPMLFSPAEIVINNLSTGRCFRFGGLKPEVLRASFFGE